MIGFWITFSLVIDDLPRSLHSNAELFADDSSLFLVIHDVDASAQVEPQNSARNEKTPTEINKFKSNIFQKYQKRPFQFLFQLLPNSKIKSSEKARGDAG